MNRCCPHGYPARVAAGLACTWLLFVAQKAAAFESLLRRIPDSANAIVVLHVDSIFASPLAQAEGWREKYADKHAGTPLIVPPTAKRFVLGSQLDIESMHPLWEVASMELSVDPSAEDIQKLTGGIVDSLSGVEVVWPKGDTCIAKFDSHEFGILSPANRQQAGRWIEVAMSGHQGDVAPYLLQAVQYAEGAGPEIVMAIDLEDLIRPEEFREAVQRSQLFHELDQAAVTVVLTSLRGVTLGVRVTDQISGKLIVDFGRPADVLAPVVKPLILNVMSNMGASLDEFAEWKPSVTGNRVSIAGPLTDVGMRRLFSMVDLDAAIVNRPVEEPSPPALPEEGPAEASGAKTGPADPAATQPDKDRVVFASRRYFNTIVRYLNDVQRPSRTKATILDKALWISNYARKIEKISTRNVDPDLVDYSGRIVNLMRDAVAFVHGSMDRLDQIQPRVTNVEIAAIPTRRRYNYGNIYTYQEYAPMARANIDVASAIHERDAVSQQAMDTAQQFIDQIQYETDSIRKEMSERYGIDF